MKVERETAGFALPFAAGVLLASYPGFHPETINTAGLQAAIITTSISLILLMHPGRKKFRRMTLLILVIAAALSAGLVCGYTCTRTSICPPAGLIRLRAENAGVKMQEFIDNIPFEDCTNNAIAKALITGDKTDIPQEIISAFRNSGASHILALSGLHLGIIYGIIRKLTSIAGNRQGIWIPRSTAIILICGAYTLATGAGPSITRAFLFILLSETASLTHRHRSTEQLLYSSLIIHLTISPQSVMETGFQLSYAAMAGIAFILPHMKSFWPGDIHKDRPFSRGVRKIWNAAALSISCQITTAPIAYICFGTFPRHFLLTNLIALPLTGIIIPLVLMTASLELFGICPVFIVKTTETLMDLMSWSLKIIASM